MAVTVTVTSDDPELGVNSDGGNSDGGDSDGGYQDATPRPKETDGSDDSETPAALALIVDVTAGALEVRRLGSDEERGDSERTTQRTRTRETPPGVRVRVKRPGELEG